MGHGCKDVGIGKHPKKDAEETKVGLVNKKSLNIMFRLLKFGSPTWARTRDLRINSPSLYRLSYRGMGCIISSEKKVSILFFRWSVVILQMVEC